MHLIQNSPTSLTTTIWIKTMWVALIIIVVLIVLFFIVNSISVAEAKFRSRRWADDIRAIYESDYYDLLFWIAAQDEYPTQAQIKEAFEYAIPNGAWLDVLKVAVMDGEIEACPNGTYRATDTSLGDDAD